MKHCLLLDRDRLTVDMIDHIDEHSWASRRVEGSGASVTLSALDLSIDLTELYEDD